MRDPDESDYVVGVVGCGAMGQGIAQVSAQGGIRTILFDAREGGAAAARERIAGHIDRMAEKGRVSAADAEAATKRLEVADGLEALAACDAVIEAIFEEIEVKRELFGRIEGVVRPDCLIASNTSSIPIASIARACKHRDRIAGLHFFNPVPLMTLVEVVRAAETSDQAVARLMALGRRMTRTPVEVKDSPGFLVNMGGRAFTTEGLRIAHEGVATPAQIDAIMRDCWHFRMGPFELMDLTGIDVNYPVSRIIAGGYMDDPRLKTSANHMAMFDAGLLGRKAGKGWFDYEEGRPKDRPSADFVTEARPVREVVLASEFDPFASVFEGMIEDNPGVNPQLEAELSGDDMLIPFLDELGIAIVEDDGEAPILAAPIGEDATEIAAAGAGHRRLICLDLTGDTSKRVTVMTAPGVDRDRVAPVAAAIMASGRAVTWINDGPGFVGQRMAAMVANLGCYMAEIGLASPEDIDMAMELALNYPRGPIALGDEMGVETCHAILAAIQRITGEDRYRPTLWLRRRAMLGLRLHTPN
ncbi:MAG TPA: 3-hydroxyacyl-CoA dehydrogenase [Paracoccaceae bacterium]|nr:3-hydroxyacyl-CoA dehydrogenase [Paracoccaceae bacterium]